MLTSLLNRWSDEESFLELAAGVASRSDYRANVTGIDGSARIFFLAALAKQSGRPALIIAQDMARAEKIYSDLASFLPAEQVNLLPARELFVNGGILTQSGDCREKRLQFLEWLHSKGEGIYVAPGEAFLSKALPPVLWQNLRIDLLASQLIDRQELLQQLVERGYERVSLTENKGQFSARGEVIDVYPPGVNMPFRLELFGDTIQSLRWYDPQTQRSGGHLENASVIPARELVLPGSVYHRGEQLIQSNLEQTLVKLRRRGEVDVLARLKQRVGQQIERLSEPDGLDLFNSYFSFFYEDGASLLDYLPPDFLVFLEEPTSVIEKETVLRREFEDYRSNSLLQGDMLFDCSEPLWKVEELLSRLPCPLISCSYFSGSITGVNLGQIYRLEAKSASYYHGKWELFRSDFKDWLKRGYRVYLLTGSEQRGRELLKVLAEPSLSDVDISENYTIDSTLSLQLIVGSLGEGFIIPGLRMAVITEHNLLPHRPKKRQLSRKEGIRLKDYRDLAVGDYVVHEHHGIGKYLGLSTLEIGGLVRDYLLLKYRGTDKLYIPVEQVEMIQKYAGGEGQTPRLHSLGGGEWQRLKGKVSSSVQQIARELLSLYAARQVVEGYGFGDDHPWQQEFEAHFPYEETPDQLKAVADVKADLGKKQPMDRLICGDVGYGKTEVALRAAFKVVMEGKQTAVLVPTTILAQQHYGTFKERFAHFPVRVAQLSRFVSPAQQKEIIRELSQGQIDIVIGTHSLLSKKVRFNDLGLMVIDEEQRFGVNQKEKMKQLRLNVDVLSMTATPIPRTLHLSLAGTRDLSIIDTPPEDRYPVQTYVVEYSESQVREAIQRELNRQGQVYFVFNRVDRIDAMAENIQRMFPDVSIAVGHGQMPETLLERIMADFQAGKYQVLVSTTIIEAGLDIPNVNTLIVYEADRLGLAQLYQIRGRVGRSNRPAYAFLTYRKDKIVSEIAQKRLKAIKEFTELGSGFKIALRDLEIRGAGNILGAEQHGFMAAIGFDLYCRLLEQAVAELKNERREEKKSVRLDLQISAYIPASYIPSQDQKVDIYQRIYSSDSLEDLQDLKEELADRYGSLVTPVQNLLAIAELRVLSRELGIEFIQQQKKTVRLQFSATTHVNCAQIVEALPFGADRIAVTSDKPLILKIRIEHNLETLLAELRLFLKELAVV